MKSHLRSAFPLFAALTTVFVGVALLSRQPAKEDGSGLSEAKPVPVSHMAKQVSQAVFNEQEVESKRTDEVFEATMMPLAMPEDSNWSVTLPDGQVVTAQVDVSKRDDRNPDLEYVIGTLSGSGRFYLGKNDASGDSDGWFLLYGEEKAWRGKVNEAGEWKFAQISVEALVCLAPGQTVVMANAPAMVGGGGITPMAITPDIPLKESRPGAASVLFLDFRGGSIPMTYQDPVTKVNITNTITFNPPVIDRTMIEKVHARVVEDYAPFDVNITTDPVKYGGAVRRMRMLVTDLQYNADFTKKDVGIGGVAGVGIFNSGTQPSDGVCWAFYNPPSGMDDGRKLHQLSNSISHELAHTLGLNHWGTSQYSGAPGAYYPTSGHGPEGHDSWSPIMGQYNLSEVVQWSKGEYNNAERRNGAGEAAGGAPGEDLNIIATSLGGSAAAGFIADDKANNRATAPNMVLSGTAPDDGGIINSATDEDYFKITLSAVGRIKLDVTPSIHGTNLDAYAELQNSSGTVVQSSALPLARNAAINLTNQPAGTYYLMVRGNAQANPATDGWSRYGSLGTYRITGTVGPNPPEITAGDPPKGSVGVAYNFNLIAINSPTSYYSTNGSLPPGLLLSGGAVSGMPTQAGVYTVTLAVANALGGSSKTFTFTIFGSASLPDSLDNLPLDWTTTSPPSSLASQLWQGQRITTQDGVDAARSGSIGSNAESILTTSVTGPGRLTFYWSVSSAVGDRLIFKLGNIEQYYIEGTVGWQQKTVLFGSGTFPISWIYRTNAGTTAGQDAGFVDRVVYQRTPQFTEGNFYAAGVVGQPFLRDISHTEDVNSWALTGGALPPGISLSSSSGQLTGTPTATGIYEPEITAINDAGSSTTSPTIYTYPDISLNTALDAAGLSWTTGGFNPWFGDNALSSHDGTDVAHSGPIRHGKSTYLQTTVTGQGTFGFWWKASTDAGSDLVTFSVDGVVQDTISGESGWLSKSLAIGAGNHTLRWEYTRDGSGNGGSNMAWVDQVSWVTPGPTINSALNVNWTCGQTYFMNLTSNDLNATWSVSETLPEDIYFSAVDKLIGAVPKFPRVVTFTLNATNTGGTTTSRIFTANIESSYAAWARNRGLAVGTANSDLDKDGLTNLAECAFGFDPNVKNPPFQPVSFDAATKRLRAVFKRRHQFFPDLKYEVQVSSDLQTWVTIAYSEGGAFMLYAGAQSISEVQTNPYPDTIYEATVTDGVAQSPSTPRRHMRVKVTQL